MSNPTLNKFFQTSNVIIPPEGPKGLRIDFDFINNQSYDLEALLAIDLDRISFFQGVYIDAYDSPNDVVIFNLDTRQRIIAPAGSQGYYPLMCTNPPRMTVTSSGAIVPMIFYNVPISASSWKATPIVAAPVSQYYSVLYRNFTSYANPTDLIEITAGSQSFYIASMSLGVRSTAAVNVDLFWHKRNAINSGGAFVNAPPVLLDNEGLLFDGVVKVYTSAPTINSVTDPFSWRRVATTVVAAIPTNALPIDQTYLNNMRVDPGQSVAINFAGAALPAGFVADLNVGFYLKG